MTAPRFTNHRHWLLAAWLLAGLGWVTGFFALLGGAGVSGGGGCGHDCMSRFTAIARVAAAVWALAGLSALAALGLAWHPRTRRGGTLGRVGVTLVAGLCAAIAGVAVDVFVGF